MPSGETTYPYDTVVYIQDAIGGVAYQGSGVLVTPNEVLTASHVVYSSQYGIASNIVVTPGYSYGFSPYGSVTGNYLHYNEIQDSGDQISPQQSQFDYALIHLSQPFSFAGTMGLESNYAGGLANITGYPAVDGGAQISQSQYLSTLYPYTVYQGIALGAGSSGGPVWIYGTNGSPDVVGLVSSENVTTGAGYFMQMTTMAFNTIESWIQEDSGACFVSGTKIATLQGDVPVELLKVGDQVVTPGAVPAEIIWIGHRHVACNRQKRPDNVWPVRVQRGGIAEGMPCRDLWLSPDHAVFLDDALIPVRHLINGATVAQVPCDRVTYWHIELAQHSILSAEGLAVESYLDTGNRGSFDNGGPVIALHPDFALGVWNSAAYAPLVRDGTKLSAIRRRLQRRALALGWRLTEQSGLRVFASGQELRAEKTGGRWRVRLPSSTDRMLLTSRTWVPSHFSDRLPDGRRLGIAISKIWIDDRRVDLDGIEPADGWHTPEAGWRWTDGRGQLAVRGAKEVVFEVAMTGTYWVPEADMGQRRAV